MQKQSLIPLTQTTLKELISFRQGEDKIGQKVKLLSSNDNLKVQLQQSKCKFAIFGIPEDIGPRANLGRGGSADAWEAFLSKFVNVQSNQYFCGSEVMVMGHIYCEDLMEKSKSLIASKSEQLVELRNLVQQIDERVYPIVSEIVSAGVVPIVIGGGHNNSYGMLRGSSKGLNSQVNAINIDPHADFRELEGRHSGNGFSYAFQQGYLLNYHILGLHESYNNQSMYEKLKENKITYSTYDDILRGELTFEQAVQQGISKVNKVPFGVEIDLDCIEYMPSSAFTPSGVTSTQIRQFTIQSAKEKNSCYLHIAEGAPSLDTDGKNIIGKMTSYIVCDFIKMKLKL